MTLGFPAFSPEFRQLFKRVLFILAVFHALFQVGWWIPSQWSRDDTERDVQIYYSAAFRLKNAEPLYQPWPEYGPEILPNRFFYPPPFLLLARPLAELSFLWFSRVWYALILTAFWVYAACLAYIVTRQINLKNTLVAGLLLSLTPGAVYAIAFANFEPVMWACYGLAIVAVCANPLYKWAPIPLAIAAMMKLHPIWALGLVISKLGKRALVLSVLTLGVGLALGIWICGWENSRSWWSATAPVVSQGNFYGGNFSLSFLLIRLIDWLGWEHQSGPLPTPFRLYLSVMSILGPLVTLYLSRHKTLAWRIALLGAATILFSPLCWNMYMPLLLLLPALWLRDKETQKWKSAPVV
jgi:hypothetical protein